MFSNSTSHNEKKSEIPPIPLKTFREGERAVILESYTVESGCGNGKVEIPIAQPTLSVETSTKTLGSKIYDFCFDIFSNYKLFLMWPGFLFFGFNPYFLCMYFFGCLYRTQIFSTLEISKTWCNMRLKEYFKNRVKKAVEIAWNKWSFLVFVLVAACSIYLIRRHKTEIKEDKDLSKRKDLLDETKILRKLKNKLGSDRTSYDIVDKLINANEEKLINNETTSQLSPRANAIMHLGVMFVSIGAAYFSDSKRSLELWNTFVSFLKISNWSNAVFGKQGENTCRNFGTEKCSSVKKGEAYCLDCAAKEAEITIKKEVKELRYDVDSIIKSPSEYFDIIVKNLVKTRSLPDWFTNLNDEIQEQLLNRIGLNLDCVRKGEYSITLTNDGRWKLHNLNVHRPSLGKINRSMAIAVNNKSLPGSQVDVTSSDASDADDEKYSAPIGEVDEAGGDGEAFRIRSSLIESDSLSDEMFITKAQQRIDGIHDFLLLGDPDNTRIKACWTHLSWFVMNMDRVKKFYQNRQIGPIYDKFARMDIYANGQNVFLRKLAADYQRVLNTLDGQHYQFVLEETKPDPSMLDNFLGKIPGYDTWKRPLFFLIGCLLVMWAIYHFYKKKEKESIVDESSVATKTFQKTLEGKRVCEYGIDCKIKDCPLEHPVQEIDEVEDFIDETVKGKHQQSAQAKMKAQVRLGNQEMSTGKTWKPKDRDVDLKQLNDKLTYLAYDPVDLLDMLLKGRPVDITWMYYDPRTPGTPPKPMYGVVRNLAEFQEAAQKYGPTVRLVVNTKGSLRDNASFKTVIEKNEFAVYKAIAHKEPIPTRMYDHFKDMIEEDKYQLPAELIRILDRYRHSEKFHKMIYIPAGFDMSKRDDYEQQLERFVGSPDKIGFETPYPFRENSEPISMAVKYLTENQIQDRISKHYTRAHNFKTFQILQRPSPVPQDEVKVVVADVNTTGVITRVPSLTGAKQQKAQLELKKFGIKIDKQGVYQVAGNAEVNNQHNFVHGPKDREVESSFEFSREDEIDECFIQSLLDIDFPRDESGLDEKQFSEANLLGSANFTAVHPYTGKDENIGKGRFLQNSVVTSKHLFYHRDNSINFLPEQLHLKIDGIPVIIDKVIPHQHADLAKVYLSHESMSELLKVKGIEQVKCNSAKLGQVVWLMYDNGKGNRTVQGKITSIKSTPDGVYYFTHDCETKPGISGAHLVDVNGHTVGVHKGKYSAGVAWAVMIDSTLKAFINSAVVPKNCILGGLKATP